MKTNSQESLILFLSCRSDFFLKVCFAVGRSHCEISTVIFVEY